MRLERSRKSRSLQASLLLSVLTTVPAFAYSTDEISGSLIAQSGSEQAASGAQSASGTESTRKDTSTGNENTTSLPATSTQTTTSSTSPTSGPGAAVTGSESTSSTNSTNSKSNASSATSTEPVQGPLLEKRKLVLSRIQAAKKQGTGISGYMAEYARIEQMVKNGEPEANYADRLSSLQNGVDEQLKRSQMLKTQRPTYSGISASSSSSSSVSSSASSGGGRGSGGGPLGGMSLDQIKAKYGDKVPPDIADKLSSMSPEKKKELLNSDIVKKFLGK